jgi:hypothetical protein
LNEHHRNAVFPLAAVLSYIFGSLLFRLIGWLGAIPGRVFGSAAVALIFKLWGDLLGKRRSIRENKKLD